MPAMRTAPVDGVEAEIQYEVGYDGRPHFRRLSYIAHGVAVHDYDVSPETVLQLGAAVRETVVSRGIVGWTNTAL